MRRGFTLIELVVVVLLLGILAAVGVPRLMGTSECAVDNSLRRTLNVMRDAIDSYSADHPGKMPGADGQEQTLKDDLAPYLRGHGFPVCPVGARNAKVRMLAGTGSHSPGIAATATTHSWVYKYETSDFFINSSATANDGTTTYDSF